jgi:LysM repeat protein
MAIDPLKGISHAVKKAGETVASTVTSAATTMLHMSSDVAQSSGHFVSNTFHHAVKDAEKEFNTAKKEIQSIVNSGQEAVLKSLAASKIQEYADIIKSLVKAWPRVVSRLGSEVDLLRSEASQKGVSPKVVKAMKKIAISPELRNPLRQAAGKSIKSFAVEFGGNVATVAGVNGALGFVAELQKIANVKRYGSVGLSLGASVGGAGNLALGLYTS